VDFYLLSVVSLVRSLGLVPQNPRSRSQLTTHNSQLAGTAHRPRSTQVLVSLSTTCTAAR